MNYSTHSSGVLHISIDIEFASFSTSGLDQTNISQLTTLWEERESTRDKNERSHTFENTSRSWSSVVEKAKLLTNTVTLSLPLEREIVL